MADIIIQNGNKTSIVGTVTITAASLPLPLNASTESTLIAVVNDLDSIDAKIDNLSTEATLLLIDSLLTLIKAKPHNLDGALSTRLKPSDTLNKVNEVTLVPTVTTVGTVSTITNVVHIDDNGGSITVDGTVGVSGTVLVTGALTDTQLRASSVPVSVATIPSHNVTNAGTFAVQVTSVPTTPVTGTFFQATQPVSIAASVAVTGPLTDTQLRATAVPVSGTVGVSGTVPVSAVSLPLPTGAATETTLSALNTKVTTCNTGAVVVSSSALPTGASTSALQTTGNTSLSTIATNTTNAATTTLQTIGNTSLASLLTNSNELHRGTTATLSSVTAVGALNTGTQTLLAAATVSARKGVMLFNSTNRTIFILFGTGTANATTSFSVAIASNAYYEVPDKFANVAIQYSIANATATNTVLVTTVN